MIDKTLYETLSMYERFVMYDFNLYNDNLDDITLLIHSHNIIKDTRI